MSVWRGMGALLGIVATALLGACSNDPYPGADATLRIRYSALPSPPKTLDPAVSYSALEHQITMANVEKICEVQRLARAREESQEPTVY